MGATVVEVRPSRKRKKTFQTENSEVCSEKKVKNFCCRTFRKELKGSEVLKSLKRFIAAVNDSDDVVYEYIENGGSLQEILSVIDVTASGDLTTALPVFEAVHLILLRCQSPDSKYRQRCIESARSILGSHMLTIKGLLSMSTSKHKKIALKVLTSIATLDSFFANEIMNLVALSSTLITDLIQPSSEKESVRKCFIMFVISFLIEGNFTVVRNLLEKKGLLSSIIPGLKFDDAATVNLTLSLFEDKILKNIKIQKTSKLKLFNTQVIKSLFDLFDWKGPEGVKQISFKRRNRVKEIEINKKEKEIVIESVHSFLLLLCCSQKYGVAFHDKSFGSSDQLKNQLLVTVFENIPDPLKSKRIADVLLKAIVSCPDLMKPILLKLEPTFQPRNTKNWFQAMDFAENLLKDMDAATILKAETEPLPANDLVKVGKILCAPVTFLKVSKAASRKTETMEIRFRCLSLLTTIWRGMQKFIGIFYSSCSDLKKQLYRHFFKFVPDTEDLLELWYTLCDTEFFNSLALSQEKRVQFLLAILESFHVISENQRSVIRSPFNLASNLLRHVEHIKESISDSQFEDIQVHIVKLIEPDVQFLSSDQELFEKSLRILLRSTDNASFSFLSKVLAGLEVFSGNKSEVDVWVLSYMSVAEEYRASVADPLIQCLRKISRMNNCSGGSHFVKDVAGSNSPPKTPIIFNSIELVKLSFAFLLQKSEKKSNFYNYLDDVVIHLQFFYGIDIFLYDELKQFSEILAESSLAFLKAWKNSSSAVPSSDVLRCPTELTIVNWIVNGDGDLQRMKEILDSENINLLKLYSLFTIVVAYLTKKSFDGELLESDVDRFSETLSLFLCHPCEDDQEIVFCVSFDFTNRAVYQRNCLDRLFNNKQLLEGFDVFQRKRMAAYNTTAVVLKVLMEKKLLNCSKIKNALTKPWKVKFLNQMKSKLKKKKKSIENSCELRKVLEFFEFDHRDASEVIDLIFDGSDLTFFVNEDDPSIWTVVLLKFVKLYCEKEELKESILKKLCLIMKYLFENCRSNIVEMTDCFLNLLKERPNHLLLIDNGVLDVILLRTDFTPIISTLGKYLLNDPRKIRHFLKSFSEKLESWKEPRIAISLLSVLIINPNPLISARKFQGERSMWIVDEINPEKTKELYDALEVVYKKYEVNILRALFGQKEKVFLENLDFTQHLVRLFFDVKKLSKIKKEIPEGMFQPKLLYEVVKKVNNNSSLVESYLQGLLTMFCRMIKNKEQGAAWEENCVIVSDVLQFNKDSAWESVVESPEWKEFAKLAVGHCFSLIKDSALLKIFRLLITAFYKADEESKDCVLFFQMVIAHSQFLKVMLGDCTLKNETVELFYRLMQRSPSQMSPKHIPILLASYSACLSPRDVTILEILRLYERSGVTLKAYEPFVWGETAVSHYSIGKSPRLSLWQSFNMRNVLDLLDRQRLELSLREFPIFRGLEGRQNEKIDFDGNVYDPAFLLPFFVNLMSPGAVVYSLTFIYKGGLAYTVRALSSECKDVRLIASLVLTRFYNHLELSQNLKQKLVWMHFINCLRYGVEDLSSRPLPNIATLFLARMTLELSRQPAEMYSPLQNYLLAKSYFSFDAVPEFLPLFHSSEMSYWKHREWILEILRDGTKTALDVGTIFHSMALKIIFCFFYSHLCDVELRKLILQVLERMLQVGMSAFLISEYGLLSWINAVDSATCQFIFHDLLNLLSTSVTVIVKDIKFHKNKHANLSYLIQILNTLMKFLCNLKCLKSLEIFGAFLKIVNKCLDLLIEEKYVEWFKLNKNRLFDIMDFGTVLLGKSHDFRKSSKLPFYFRCFDEESQCEIKQDLRHCAYLARQMAGITVNDENKNGS